MSLVYVWMWGVWGLGSGDKNVIELDTLHDTSLLPVQKWGPHYTSVPSCRGISQGPGGEPWKGNSYSVGPLTMDAAE